MAAIGRPGAGCDVAAVDLPGRVRVCHVRKPGRLGDDVRCAAGINVATLDWCMKEWKIGHRILLVEFTAADIAAIPTADGREVSRAEMHSCWREGFG